MTLNLPENYFAALDLPVAYQLDAAQLRKAYLLRSRELHPDHQDPNDPAAQERALALTAYLNAAQKTLSKPDTRLAYLLKLQGLLEGDERADARRQMPQEFLMEMLELNEQLSELEAGGDAAALGAFRAQVQGQEQQVLAEIASQMQAFDAAGDGPNPDATRHAVLQGVLGLYLQLRYYLRLSERLNTFAAPTV
jgi:molecular chaperone HscB